MDDAQARIDEILDRIPLTRGRPRVVTPVTGGLTNETFRVKVDDNDLLVRVFAPDMELFGVDRENECANTQEAARWGVAPKVLEANSELGVLVSEFVSGRTLLPPDLTHPGTMERVVKTLRRLHSGSTFQGSFNVQQFRIDYLERVRTLDLQLPIDYDELLPRIETLERLLASTPMPLVPCHNDLASENMIDDGERVWLVDFEFAAMNEASFDLANMALSSALSSDAIRTLTTAYGDSATTPAAQSFARVRAWLLIATFAWVPWTAIQDHITRTEFDFAAWMQPRYQRAVPQVSGPAFDRLLDDLASGEPGGSTTR